MIRILIIGRSASEWGERMSLWAPERVEIDTARLPASGLRQFEATPPDAVLIVEASKPGRASTMVDAFRERPVGQLIPIVVVAPEASEDSVDTDAADAWLGEEVDENEVRGELEDLLGEELSSPPSPQSSSVPDAARQTPGIAPDEGSGAPSSSEAASSDYILEEIDDFEEYEDRPRRMNRSSIFAGSGRDAQTDEERIGEEDVRRKLKQVRHEDYFAILEIRRGASRQAAREAFHRLHAAFDADRLAFDISHDFADELGEIRDALEDAWAVLGDTSLREDYLEHTTRK